MSNDTQKEPNLPDRRKEEPLMQNGKGVVTPPEPETAEKAEQLKKARAGFAKHLRGI